MLSSVGFIFLFVRAWASSPQDWPFYVSMLVMSGVLPLWNAWKERRALARAPITPPSFDSARFSYWVVSAYPTPATLTLVSTLVAVSVVQIAGPGLSESVLRAGLVKTHALDVEAWRLFTGPMLHGSLLHLLFNSVSLAGLAMFVESLAGTPRVGLIFLLSALGGSVLSALTLSELTVGASGGIMGLLGFLLVVSYRHRAELPLPFSAGLIRAVFAIGLAGLVANQYIDNAAHGGGFVVGLVLGLIEDRSTALPLVPSPVSAVVGWVCLVATVAAGAGAAFAMTQGPFAPGFVTVMSLATPLFARRRRAQLAHTLAANASDPRSSLAPRLGG